MALIMAEIQKQPPFFATAGPENVRRFFSLLSHSRLRVAQGAMLGLPLLLVGASARFFVRTPPGPAVRIPNSHGNFRIGIGIFKIDNWLKYNCMFLFSWPTKCFFAGQAKVPAAAPAAPAPEPAARASRAAPLPVGSWLATQV